jgi:hypothetical protein
MPDFIRVTISRTPVVGWITLHDAVDEQDIQPGDVVFALGSFEQTPNGSLLPTRGVGNRAYKGFLYLNAQRLYVPIPDDKVFEVAQALEHAKKERSQ